jgi:peptidoglycan/LPS O-acetylase OafA/YrhL
LLPLALTVILVTLIIAPFVFYKPYVKDISKDIFPALFSYFNFHALYDFGNYWSGKAEQSLFLHTWSLSVEEQFYLFYPFLLYFAYKYFKNFTVSILIITIVSLFLFFFYSKINHDFDFAFYMLPTRIWELSIGGLIVVIKKPTIKNESYLPIIGIFFIVISFLIGSNILYLLPVFGAALIVLFSTPNDVIGKLLSTKPFVFIGKISYSLYLWHWVIIVLFKNLQYQFQEINHHLINGLIILSTFLLAYLSYTFIENRTRNYQHTPKIVLAGIAIIVGITLYYQSDFYKPYYNSKYNKSTYYVSYYDISPTQVIQDTNDPIWYNVIRPIRLPEFTDAYKKEGIITNKKNGNPKIILIGDSHGVMWGKLLDEISDELNFTLSCYTSNASMPFFNMDNINLQDENKYYTKIQRIEYAKSIVGNIEKWKPKVVVLACRWENLDEKTKKQLDELLFYIEKRNVNVLLFTQPPVLNFMEEKNSGQYFTYLGIQPNNGYNLVEVNNSNVKKSNDYIKSLVAKYSNVSVYDVYKNMLSDNKIKISFDNDLLYFDDDHLSYYGAAIHKQNILSKINSIINSNNFNRDENGSH